jgi:hypothetical protein
MGGVMVESMAKLKGKYRGLFFAAAAKGTVLVGMTRFVCG